MKKLLILVLTLTLFSCSQKGETINLLNGNENNLPDELKGLKIYNVSTGSGNAVKVAIIDNKINSTTYRKGKITESVIIINNDNREIIVKEVIIENDSIIVCRK